MPNRVSGESMPGPDFGTIHRVHPPAHQQLRRALPKGSRAQTVMKIHPPSGGLLFTGLLILPLVAASCGSSSSDSKSDSKPAQDHSQIVLRDRLGVPLTPVSTEPYSPRQTCGACHDVDEIANGYHFQQGRTDAFGAIHTTDDFFADGRTWLKSPGMYGKW